MLRSLNDIRNFKIHALDGDLGSAHDFYFDDREWVVRYIVVDTGTWLPGRRVLLSPAAVQGADWNDRRLAVMLSRDEIRQSPGAETDLPVSRQYETELTGYYGWPVYWGIHDVSGIPTATSPAATNAAIAADRARALKETATQDPDLRSAKEVMGYYIQASDGGIGHVKDFLVDDELWTIRYLVIDTRNWLPGKKVVISPAWIDDVNWKQTKVFTRLSRAQVKDSPEYDPDAPLERDYETRLHDHYGQARYWEQTPPNAPAP